MDSVLIMVIVNKGYTDLVMEAALDSGARGGTVLNARGTGNSQIEEFYGVQIKPDKEIVMIVVNNEIKDKVLEAIGKAAGLNTKGQGIAFVLPVSDTVGLEGENEDPIKK
jgi:nitrogen regulatory protein PII